MSNRELRKIAQEIAQIKRELTAFEGGGLDSLIKHSFALEQKYIKNQKVSNLIEDLIWKVENLGTNKVSAMDIFIPWMEGGWEEELYRAGILDDLMELDPELNEHQKQWLKKMWPQYQKLAKIVHKELKKQGYNLELDLKFDY